MSGRGGTTGRAAGCPARVGRGAVLSGIDGAPGVSTAGGADVRADAGGNGGSGADGAGGIPEGSGCRGPESIWPGRGAAGATGRAGTGPVRNGGCMGELPPEESGGRIGDGLPRGGSSASIEAAPLSETGAGAGASATGAAAGFAGGAGGSCTAGGAAGSS